MSAQHRTSAILAGVVLAIIGLLAGSPVLAADADPTSEDVAVASLLQAVDVAPATSSEGVSLGSSDDLPGYLENGGLREVRQTWSTDDPIRTIFDFRWQFPDADSAASFLDAAEDVLSEASSGAERGMLLLNPLPDTRFYTFEDRVLGTGTVGFNYLMRHENLVAKVYVAGIGEELAEGDATAIAYAAAARMIAAVGAEAGPLPSASRTPADAEAALGELLAHVPEAVRETCAEPTDGRGPASDVGELAEVRCPMADGAVLTFVLYETVEAMDAAFDTAQEYARIFGSFTTGSDCASGTYDGTWSMSDVEAGRLLCHALEGAASIVWSHPASRILAIIRQPEADHAAAWELWLIAGPV